MSAESGTPPRTLIAKLFPLRVFGDTILLTTTNRLDRLKYGTACFNISAHVVILCVPAISYQQSGDT